MRNRKRKNQLIILAMCITLIVMSTGYAILAQNIKVDGTISVERDWDVRITGITDGTPTGAAANAKAPTFDNTTATFDAYLYNPGDAMEYTVTIENLGSMDAVLETITLTDTNNPAVKFTTTGLTEGAELLTGDKHYLTVRVEYDGTGDESRTTDVGELTVNLLYSQLDEYDGGGSGEELPQ